MLSEQQTARLLDLGNLACQKGLVREARTIFDGVLALKPHFVPALIGLAFSHVVVDDFATAQTILDKVLDTHPDDADALAMMGLAQILSGQKEKAEQTFARISGDSTAADLARVVMEMD